MKLSDAKPVAKAFVRRALLSVFDKSELKELARALVAERVELLASGGTAAALRAANIPVTLVEEFTESPEVLGGRVKTLHPRIHAGILAHRGDPEHTNDLAQHGYVGIDLVVCNLYPFADALARGAARHELVENIDIGGPTLLRAAAKNADGGVTVLVDPADYAPFVQEFAAGGTTLAFRRRAQAKAFRHVAAYDDLIATWASGEVDPADGATAFPAELTGFELKNTLRYGENPHQKAALYTARTDTGGVGKGKLLTGKELSYTNFLDLDAAYRAVFGLTSPACSIIKHTNPCGLAMATTQAEAFARALAADPVSAYGSVLGFNTPLGGETARAIREAKLFVECIAAPSFSPEAKEIFEDRTNLRLLEVPAGSPLPALAAHRIGGGLLVQEPDTGAEDPSAWRTVTKKQPEPGWLTELAFAMHIARILKSNAIAITKDLALIGSGTGQTSRVDATAHALAKAGTKSAGSFLASDAFFPFDDSVRLAAKAGVAAVVQPGGSKRDAEVIAACNDLGLVMIFTGQRHFKH